ncbi:MAG: 2-dehydro-3-deoxygalactonokinase, partial [Alphaproteobacteria bacterium]|nr:2-dehydro-3-deoxygalactonokinase [Alphaproteobacteria bacterium]
MTAATALIAVDWGTSSFRAYRMGADGTVLDQHAAPRGILKVENGEFADALRREIGPWLVASAAPVLMAGMIGSRQGWSEAPYLPCPAGLDDVATRLHPVAIDESRRGWIVPGLVHRPSDGPPDVMRGEETQVFGALASLGPGRHRVCMPGTHSKWVDVADACIVGFATYMTGEVFAVMKSHSILGRLIAEDAIAPEWFDRGVARARDDGGLLHHLFGVRTHGLFGDIPASGLAGYLSGLLIGHELNQAIGNDATIHVLGAAALASLYGRAIQGRGRSVIQLDPDASRRCMFA